MPIVEQAQRAVGRYDLGGDAKICRQLEATHAAFQVRAGDRLYALRQFNPYMDAEALRTQFLLAGLMREAGLNTPLPVPTDGGEPFVEVEGRLWAVFPWCNGRPGASDCMADLFVLASVQGKWIECGELVRASRQWETIVRCAGRHRQRKSWAWVVPLDQVPRFAHEQMIVDRARAEAPEGPYREAFLHLACEVGDSVRGFDRLLERQRVRDLSHAVTHGDFWVSNVSISEDTAAVLDLDCYSFEPRVTDFARAANWYYRERSASENAQLFREFQAHAHLGGREIETLPLMMCTHDLFYCVARTLLFMEERESLTAQRRLIETIRAEARASERYERERDSVLHTFLADL
jgi:Ser/Thr protein kinase RdoA (MazF antagonist)